MHYILAFLRIILWGILMINTMIYMCLSWILGDKEIFNIKDIEELYDFKDRMNW